MKNILCILGWHKPDEDGYVTLIKCRGKHRFRRNYAVCKRCGKTLYSVSLNRWGERM